MLEGKSWSTARILLAWGRIFVSVINSAPPERISSKSVTHGTKEATNIDTGCGSEVFHQGSFRSFLSKTFSLVRARALDERVVKETRRMVGVAMRLRFPFQSRFVGC